ncbi:MAG: thiamine-phosphate kinase [Pseudomonadota bacterium]|nr:thiamine-phosphate kinase [Pseudomonadota bacterium]
MVSLIELPGCFDPVNLPAGRLRNDIMRRGEFDLIREVFAPLCHADFALGLLDDAAVIPAQTNFETVISTDTLVADVHFFRYEKPEIIARRLLRVNLSDIASMGAEPSGYFLNLTMPLCIDDKWLVHFADGLRLEQDEFGMTLLGGDTTHTPGPLTISVTMLGKVPEGCAVRRSTAQPGDVVFVSGTIGDAVLGMAQLKRKNVQENPMINRYQLPTPRVQLGQSLRKIASAMVDVSDGLISDFGHLCSSSGVGAIIESGVVPISRQARAAIRAGDTQLSDLLVGGDDYELVFTAPPDREADVAFAANSAGVSVTKIGKIVGDPNSVRVLNAQGAEITFKNNGYTHF